MVVLVVANAVLPTDSWRTRESKRERVAKAGLEVEHQLANGRSNVDRGGCATTGVWEQRGRGEGGEGGGRGGEEGEDEEDGEDGEDGEGGGRRGKKGKEAVEKERIWRSRRNGGRASYDDDSLALEFWGLGYDYGILLFFFFTFFFTFLFFFFLCSFLFLAFPSFPYFSLPFLLFPY